MLEILIVSLSNFELHIFYRLLKSSPNIPGKRPTITDPRPTLDNPSSQPTIAEPPSRLTLTDPPSIQDTPAALYQPTTLARLAVSVLQWDQGCNGAQARPDMDSPSVNSRPSIGSQLSIASQHTDTTGASTSLSTPSVSLGLQFSSVSDPSVGIISCQVDL